MTRIQSLQERLKYRRFCCVLTPCNFTRNFLGNALVEFQNFAIVKTTKFEIPTSSSNKRFNEQNNGYARAL